MKKIIAIILAVAVVIGFGYLYVYIFWLRLFNGNPDKPTWFILIVITIYHLIIIGAALLLEKILDFITDNL